jgi:pumilio RNA-binding family
MIEQGSPDDKTCVFTKLRGLLVQMAKHKYASNVCEKVLLFSEPYARNLLIAELLALETDGSGNITGMQLMRDQYGSK